MKNLFAELQLKKKPCEQAAVVSDEDLNVINNLKRNGPLKILTKDDIQTRAMIILGEDPTTKMSVHPEISNKKETKVLTKLSKLLVSTPMMVGHVLEKTPWGRCFTAEVIKEGNENFLKEKFWFMNDEEGQIISRKIDGGIWAEGSISYRFEEARCRICHLPMAYTFFGIARAEKKRCQHKLGEKDAPTGLICYWYPHNIQMVLETSYVFAGAYRKTRSMFNSNKEELMTIYNADDVDGGILLEKQLVEYHNLKLEDNPTALNDSSDLPPTLTTEEPNNDTPNNKEKKEKTETPKTDNAGKPANKESGEEITGSSHIDEQNTPRIEIPPIIENVSQNESTVKENNPPLESGTNTDNSATGLNSESAGDGDAARLNFRTEGEEQEFYEALYDCTLELDEIETLIRRLLTNDTDVVKALSVAEVFRKNLGERSLYREAICSEECGYCEAVEGGVPEKCPACSAALEVIEYAPGIFKPYGPIKPKKSGTVNNEFFKKEDFINLPSGTYMFEPKYDGIWMELHKHGNKVKLFSDEGNEYARKFPGIVKEAQDLKADNFAIAGEMVKYKGNKRLGHEDVSAHIHSKEDMDDKDFRFKPFDAMLMGGKDLTRDDLEPRRKELDANVKWGKQIHPTSFRKMEHKAGSAEIVKVIEDRKTREGTMIKDVTGKYIRKDESKIYKWKSQVELDVKVTGKKDREGGGWVYECEVGRGKEAKHIGSTYTTDKAADVGDIIRVTMDKVTWDKEKDSYSWTAPKVLAVRKDKKRADPLSTVKKFAVEKGAGEPTKKTLITLSEVVAKLHECELEHDIWITGSLVESGVSTHDIDMLSREDLTADELSVIKAALGEELEPFFKGVIVDSEGPAGPNVKLETKGKKKPWKYAGEFVLQEHGWGKKIHYDIRMGAPKTPRMWGYTIFSKPSTEAGGPKSRAQEKAYHDPSWMEINKRNIKPGEPGHPGTDTYKGDAWMVKVDGGVYDYIRRKPGFLELVLHGKKYNGRYLWREITVAKKAIGETLKGEDKAKDEKIWIMWKPKDQTVGGDIKKMCYDDHRGVLVLWESNEIDIEFNSIPDETPLEE